MGKNYDCAECRSNRHDMCHGGSCNCGVTDHLYPIRAAQRLNTQIKEFMADESQPLNARANQSVLAIAGAMSYENRAEGVDLMEIALALAERDWAGTA